MALVMIAIIKDYKIRKGNNIAGFRIIDTETYEYRDVTYNSARNAMLNGTKIYNLKLKGNEVISANGEITRYPVVNANTTDYKKFNVLVAIATNINGYLEFSNCMGRITTAPEEAIKRELAYRQYESKYANICLRNKSNNEINEERGGYTTLPNGQWRNTTDDIVKKTYIDGRGEPIYKRLATGEQKEKLEKAEMKVNMLGDIGINITEGMELTTTEQVKDLEYFKVPNGVRYIIDRAFKDSYIKGITLNEGIVSIGSYAFNRCVQLKEIKIPDSVQLIGEGAFAGSGIQKIELPTHENFKVLTYRVLGNTKLRRLYIPDNVEEIDMYALASCDELELVRVSTNVTKIADSAFSDCRKLRAIDLRCKISSIPSGLFTRCHSLQKVLLNDNTVDIGKYAFNGCKLLSDEGIPWRNIETIGKLAFSDCHSLRKIQLDNIKAIDEVAFKNCKNLKEVVITSKYKYLSLEDDIFRDCYNLMKVVLPRRLSYMVPRLELGSLCKVEFID